MRPLSRQPGAPRCVSKRPAQRRARERLTTSRLQALYVRWPAERPRIRVIQGVTARETDGLSVFDFGIELLEDAALSYDERNSPLTEYTEKYKTQPGKKASITHKQIT